MFTLRVQHPNVLMVEAFRVGTGADTVCRAAPAAPPGDLAVSGASTAAQTVHPPDGTLSSRVPHRYGPNPYLVSARHGLESLWVPVWGHALAQRGQRIDAFVLGGLTLASPG